MARPRQIDLEDLPNDRTGTARHHHDAVGEQDRFVDGVGDSAEQGALAEAVVQLGNTLHLQTVAEGIEEARQVEGLRALGCQLGQGFYFAKALPPDEIDDLLTRQSANELSLAASVISEETKR